MNHYQIAVAATLLFFLAENDAPNRIIIESGKYEQEAFQYESCLRSSPIGKFQLLYEHCVLHAKATDNECADRYAFILDPDTDDRSKYYEVLKPTIAQLVGDVG